jgi:hypothetical protein
MPAAADTWSEREGLCGEWHGTWELAETQPGVWTGTVFQWKAGGACVPADGQILTGSVEVRMSGDKFSARKSRMPGMDNCSYSGIIDGGQIAGTYSCPPPVGTFDFTIHR